MYAMIRKILTYGGCVIALGLLVLSFIIFPKLPNEVPIHINLFGVPDQFGGKLGIFVWPVVIFLVAIAQNVYDYSYGQRVFKFILNVFLNVALLFVIISVRIMYYHLIGLAF